METVRIADTKNRPRQLWVIAAMVGIACAAWVLLSATHLFPNVDDPEWTWITYGPLLVILLLGVILALSRSRRQIGGGLILGVIAAVVVHFVFVLAVALPGAA